MILITWVLCCLCGGELAIQLVRTHGTYSWGVRGRIMGALSSLAEKYLEGYPQNHMIFWLLEMIFWVRSLLYIEVTETIITCGWDGLQ